LILSGSARTVKQRAFSYLRRIAEFGGLRLFGFTLLSFGVLSEAWAGENGKYGKKRDALPDLKCEPAAGDTFHGSLPGTQECDGIGECKREAKADVEASELQIQ